MPKRSSEASSAPPRQSTTKKSKKSSQAEQQPASQTLYIKNLNDKVSLKTIKHSLYLLFSSYGDVIDIILNYKNHSMRGQAHVIFGNVQSSIIAMRSLQNFEFFNKEMKIEYSKSPSKVVVQANSRDDDKEAGSELAEPEGSISAQKGQNTALAVS